MSEQMRDPGDAKAWFYLDNRADIEQWAQLRGAARDLVERHLLQISDGLDDWASEVGAVAYRRDLDTGSWPRMGLYRAAWRHGERNDLTIVLEWERSRILSTGRSTFPHVGVRVSPKQVDAARRQVVADSLAALRQELGFDRSRLWPMWRYVAADETRGIDPQRLADATALALRDLWVQAAPVLEELHG